MDLGTVIGVICGLACILIAVISGGGGAIFFHIPSMMITGGGMLSATMIHFSLGQVFGITSVVKKALFCKLPSEQDLIQKMVNYSAINRRDGALALEKQLPTADDPFLIKAMQMVIDGEEEEAVDRRLSMEVQYLRERHLNGKKILEFMGASAPAFGMIGTLIGLVLMLRSLKNPEDIGGGMAVALLTTFYGALMANLFFLPLAGKLGIRSQKEAILGEMIIEGTLGIVRGESPTAVRECMQTFVSAKHREDLRPSI